MSNIVELPRSSWFDTPNAEVLEMAKEWSVDSEPLIIIGTNRDGRLCIAGNKSDVDLVLGTIFRGAVELTRIAKTYEPSDT